MLKQSTKAAHSLLNMLRREPTTSFDNKHNFKASFQRFVSVKDTSQIKGELQSNWKPPIHLILSSQDALHEFQPHLLVSPQPRMLPDFDSRTKLQQARSPAHTTHTGE